MMRGAWCVVREAWFVTLQRFNGSTVQRFNASTTQITDSTRPENPFSCTRSAMIDRRAFYDQRASRIKNKFQFVKR